MSQHTSGAAPRHGKHSAGNAQPAARRYVPRDGYELEPDSASAEQDAPRPIGVDPAQTGSFQRISAGQGATVETRQNVSKISADSTSSWTRIGLGDEMRLQGSHKPSVQRREARYKTSRKLFVGLGVAVAVVLALGGFLFWRALSSSRSAATRQEQAQGQTQADGTITNRGTTFALRKQSSGKYALVSWPEGGSSQTVYFELDGVPVQLVLYNGALIVPENLDGSWDLLAYQIGGGSVETQVTDADGNAVRGEGSIESVELQGSSLRLHTSDGRLVVVPLG
ncbi:MULTISPECIES: hypothetical protein [unclassified Olsenella]|uniref:hypothetical protein n=1 Tax=unclassified Olsenella TaxID=2638792 RepID=UPI000231F2F7|nr:MULTISPECIES: hypothetical protein [unclassified Olsenella]EHF02904.1 hypothetical protein HMPREF1008_00549 [Olsenella sp. oral taxon 809 str. F0356]KXB61874.1 hypothetical protein HMPREF1868_01724 [Olsenella sp. DNF00959]